MIPLWINLDKSMLKQTDLIPQFDRLNKDVRTKVLYVFINVPNIYSYNWTLLNYKMFLWWSYIWNTLVKRVIVHTNYRTRKSLKVLLRTYMERRKAITNDNRSVVRLLERVKANWKESILPFYITCSLYIRTSRLQLRSIIFTYSNFFLKLVWAR